MFTDWELKELLSMTTARVDLAKRMVNEASKALSGDSDWNHKRKAEWYIGAYDGIGNRLKVLQGKIVEEMRRNESKK